MHLGRLDDRARRRDEPVEALRHLEPRDRPRRLGRRRRCARSPSRCWPHRLGVEVGRERGQPALVELRARGQVAERAAEDDHARVDPLAALDPRHDADDRVGEGATALTGFLGLRDEGARRLEPRPEVVDVDAAVVAVEPRVRDRCGDLLQQLARHRWREPLVGLDDRAGVRQQHVLGDRLERPPRVLVRGRRRRGGSRARRRGRSATAGRASASRFVFWAVRSTFVTSASSQTIAAASSGDGAGPAGGRNGSAPGRKSTPRFGPALASSRSWISASGSARPIVGIELDDRELGHGEAERAGELAGDDLRHERLASLPGAAELEHVEAVVVSLDDGRQRAALAQRSDVPRRGRSSANSSQKPRRSTASIH